MLLYIIEFKVTTFLFCLVFAMFFARLFICALWPPAGKGLTSWLSFVVSNGKFVTFPLVSFLIFAPLQTLLKDTTQ